MRSRLEIIRPLDNDETRVGAVHHLALRSALVSGLLLAGSLLVLSISRKEAALGTFEA